MSYTHTHTHRCIIFMSYLVSSTFSIMPKTGLCTEEIFGKYLLLKEVKVFSFFALHGF